MKKPALNALIEQTFETPIGKMLCGLKSNCSEVKFASHRNYENGNSEMFETAAHRIELITFKIRQPLYNGGKVTDSQGWIWNIEKTKEIRENIEIYCHFEQTVGQVEFDSACGENLDAIEIFNNDWTVHIGTEDGEALSERAKNKDDFPSRLADKVDFYNSITQMQQKGLFTEVPELEKTEKLYLQYLTAYDKRDTTKINTWLAVDEFKRKLESWIGIG